MSTQPSDLAEGTQAKDESAEPTGEEKQAKGESAEPTSNFQMTTVSVVHSRFRDIPFPAEEGLLSQVGIEYEGRDDTNTQDAAMTTVEAKPYPDA